MIVKNEAERLSGVMSDCRCFADEIVVVDTGSTDGTKAIARGFTSSVFDFEWTNDFAAARNHSFTQATGRYILWLDADDRIQPDMRGRINALKAYFDGTRGFYFLLKNIHNDGHASSCYQLRCIPRRKDVCFEGRIHEQIFPAAIRSGLELVTTDITVEHYGYTDHESRIAKAERNLSMLEKERQEGRDDEGLHFFLALTYEGLGREAEAIASMEAALQKLELRNRNSHLLIEAYLFLARYCMKEGKREQALRFLAKGAALVDGSPQHCFQVGILYQRLERHAQALSWLDQVPDRQPAPGLYPTHTLPSREEILLHITYSLLCMRKNVEAMETLRNIWKLGHNIRESWEWLGLKALGSGRIGLAIHAFEAALRAGKLSLGGYLNMGRCYRIQGFVQKARQCWHMALESDPTNQDVLRELDSLQLQQLK